MTWVKPPHFRTCLSRRNSGGCWKGRAMTFPVSPEARKSAELLLKEESLTPLERVLVEGLLDGTWRLTPDGFPVSSATVKQSKASPISDKPGEEESARLRESLSGRFPEATERLLDWAMYGN